MYAAAVAAFRRAMRHSRRRHAAVEQARAMLAYGGESDDVLYLYHIAMDLCPLYTGAWVNVETAHGNGGEPRRHAVLLACAFCSDVYCCGKMLALTI